MENKKIFDIIPPKKVELEKKEEVEEIIEEIEKKKPFCSPFFKISISILVLLILIGGALHFKYAGAEIEIWPEIKTSNFDTKLTVDTKTDRPDFPSQVIPGQIFEDEKAISQNFSSSGKTLKEESAQGTIKVYNNYHSSQPLVKNTRFQPPLEKVLYFCSKKGVVIPTKSELDIEVRACLPGGKPASGEEYNIGPSTFSIPGLAGTPQYYSIYGKSFSSMSGGFKGEVRQVTKEDLEGAKKVLLKKLEDESRDYLKSKISQDFVLLNEGITREIIEATSSVPEGHPVDSFDFNLKIKLKTILFKKSDLDNFAKELVNSRFQETTKKIQKELETNYSAELVNLEIGKIVLNLKILAKVYSEINVADLKNNLLGKSLRDAQFSLGELPEISKYQIKPFPFWLTKIPENSEKVTIKLRVD